MSAESDWSSKLIFAIRAAANLQPRTTAAGVLSRPVPLVERREELEGLLKKARAPPPEFRKISSRPTQGAKSRSCECAGFLHLTLAMTLLSLVLVAVLAIASQPVEAVQELVTFGSVIKLQHERTKARLHSHDVPYGSGSGQQSVTAFPGVEDGNSYWRVETVDDDHEQGDVIPNGAIVRLQHVRTQKWLHSEQVHRSPISGNLEVSAWGVDDEQTGRSGDHWKLEIQGSGPEWTIDQKVRLRHVDTGSFLHSHKMMYNQLNQQEVCGVTKKNADNLWSAAEGIYFRPRGSSVE